MPDPASPADHRDEVVDRVDGAQDPSRDATNAAMVRVARLHRLLAHHLLRRVDLHPGQELIMFELWDRGPQRQADLVDALDSDSATITRAVRRLETAGLVRREPSPDDRRATIISTTSHGSALRVPTEAVWREIERLTLVDVDADDRTRFAGVLHRIEENLLRALAEERAIVKTCG